MEQSKSAPNHSPPWQPGLAKRLPWTPFLALLLALSCVAANGLILSFSNGRPKAEWRYAPNIWLAVLSAAANSLLQYAQAEGVNVSWWTRSMRGTSLADLHRHWAQGTGLFASILAGRRLLSLTVLAKIFTVACLIDGPLLQRASTIVSRSMERPESLNVSIATNVGNFSSISGEVGSLSTELVQVISDYEDARPILVRVEGCDGTCTGRVRTLGLNGSCSISQTKSVDMAKHFLQTANWNFEATLLNVTFPFLFFWDMLKDDRRLLDFEVDYFTLDAGPAPIYSGTCTDPQFPESCRVPTCPGVLTTKSCSYNIGVVEYPVSITNSTLTLVSNDSTFPMVSMDTFLRSAPGEVMSNGYYNETRAYGFTDAARWLSASQITLSPLSIGFDGVKPTFAWTTKFSGPLVVQNLVITNDSTCARTVHDPTDFILRSLSEILLRVGVATAQSDPWPMQTVEATQTWDELVYTSDMRYFAAAACVMLLAVVLVAGTFQHWWILGRAASLSPVEIAKAFDAPLLAGQGGSNDEVGDLLEVVGPKQVRYGAVGVSDAEVERRQGEGGRQARRRKLCMAESSQVHDPVVDEWFI